MTFTKEIHVTFELGLFSVVRDYISFLCSLAYPAGSYNNSVCTSNIGSVTFTCNPGFEKLNVNDTSCVAIDYCSSVNNKCPTNSTCSYSNGAYNCICQSGYSYDPSTLLCVDINECTATTANCPTNSFCINTPGSYVCECKTGYADAPGAVASNTPVCSDIDECTISSTLCGTGQTCENTVGSYQCRCTVTGNLAVNGACITTTAASTTTALTSPAVVLNVDNTGLILAIILPIMAVAILLLFAIAVCYFWFKM